MHPANRNLWKYLEKKYEPYFHGPNTVAECGSKQKNGVIRPHFSGFLKYRGIDWREGECVDVVSLVHELPANYDGQFNTVASSSMLEHDPYWGKSIFKMVKMMREDGILLLSWGSQKNPSHCLDHADDGCFHALASGKVLWALNDLGIYVHESSYETRFGKDRTEWVSPNGEGESYIVGFKDQKYAIGERYIEPLQPEDDIPLTEEEMAVWKSLKTA